MRDLTVWTSKIQNIKAADFSETSATLHESRRRHIPKNLNLHINHKEIGS